MIEPPKPLVLTAEERQSPLWRALMAHMRQRLDDARRQNDGDQAEVPTARLRGRISELKVLMSLNDEPIQ